MKKLKFNTVRAKLTFWFLTITLVPLFIGIIITFNKQSNSIKKGTLSKLTAIRDLKVQQLENWLNARIYELEIVSSDNELFALENIIFKENKNNSDLEEYNNIRNILNRHLKYNSALNEIFIINPKTGIVEISTNKNNQGLEVFNNDYFTQPMQSRDVYIKDIYYSKTISKEAMSFSIPLFSLEHKHSRIIGILVARIDLENSLYKFLKIRTGLGKTGETLIVNKDFLALSELRWYENAPLRLKINAEPAVNAVNGETGISHTTDYRDKKVMSAYTYIPQTKWGFVAKQDMSELNAPIRNLIKNFIILLIISTVLIVLIVLLLSKKILEPIVAINKVSQKITKGNYSIRAKVQTKNEIGLLADSINEMASSIESSNIVQKGLASIIEKIIEETSMEDFGLVLLKQLMKISEANMSTFYILNEMTSEFEPFVSVGANKNMLKPFNADNTEGEFGNAISNNEIYYLRKIPENTIFKYRTTAGDIIPKEIITIPVLIDNIVVAIISLVNIHEFSKEFIEILKQSWQGINILYSNLIASERTKVFAEQLSITNQQLEKQSEELQEQSEELQEQSEELQEQSEELQSQTEELQMSSDELQQQNIEMEIQRKQVVEANRLKSEFLSNMSHELRTPLNSINALSQVLAQKAKNKLNDDENNYLEIIERNGKLLLSLINDILDLSKIEAGKMDIIPKSVSMKSLINMVKENLFSISEKKNILININIPDNLPYVETDETKIYQVLLNVISNAVKFTEKGSVTVSVKLDIKNLVIDVKDTGIGISQKMLPYVFDEFRQVDGSSSRKYEGTGLGLAISKKIINVLGGSISAKSELGIGSVFTIIVPIKWYDETISNKIVYNKITKPLIYKKTILVVDDDKKIANEISESLDRAAYNVITAYSGKEALALAEKHHPFAITLDIIMPEMDGWEVLQKLKSNNNTKDIPVIIISVSDDKDTGFALGAVGYISKPVDKNLLISEIKNLNIYTDVVMIADDNDFERKQMAELIEAENIKTILADDGKKCLKLLNEKNPDILVLDLLMPEMDGFKVLDEIRKNPKTINLPVIIVTAKDLTKNDRMLLKGKVDSVITKTDKTSEDLFNEIKRIINELEKKSEIRLTLKKSIEKRILIIDDSNEAIIQMKSILERDNYIIDVAKGSQQALDYVKNVIPDGIILNLMMHEIDGFKVLENIRNTNETKKIPVLILSDRDLTQYELAKLNTNNIQQLISKGDLDIDALIFKVKLMLNKDEIINKNPKFKNLKSEVSNLKHNILIIEDNPDNMTTLKAVLNNNFIIFEAIDGEQGLEMALNNKYDLILLDMSLPKIDGEEVLKILKKNEITKNTPVLVVTAQAMKGDKEKFIKMGFDGYIQKPIDTEILFSEINKFLK